MELDRALHLLYELSHQDLTLCRNCKEHCDKNGCIYGQAFDTVHVEILKIRKSLTAEWLRDKYYETASVKCSNCKYEVWGSGLDVLPEFKYCPNCGAKMKGV